MLNILLRFISEITVKLRKKMHFFQTQWYRYRLGRIGEKVTIMNGCVFTNPETVFFGNNVLVNFQSVFFSNPTSSIQVGDNVIIGPRCMFITTGHAFDIVGKFIIDNPLVSETIVIEDDVWIGANVIVLPGVKISKGSVVGAGSVVTKDVKPYSIITGIPAKRRGHRFKTL